MSETGFENLKELLILLSRYPFDEKNRERFSGLISEVRDWSRMVELINAHGIIALSAYNIRQAGLEKSIPEEAMAKLDNGWNQSLMRNTWLTERWKEVNAILNKAGIRHILLKGMALEHTLYGSKGLRQMSDNDILINRDDAMKAWELLQKNGFNHGLLKSVLHSKILCDIGKHLPCLYKNGYALEIHHKLADNILIYNSKSDLFNDAVEIIISRTKALVLSREHQAAHIIDHFEKHLSEGETQMRLYADILLLDPHTKTKIPDEYILTPRQTQSLKQFRKAYKNNVYSVPLNNRLAFIIGDLFPSLEWMKKRYSCGTFSAVTHYPLRIGKLLLLI